VKSARELGGNGGRESNLGLDPLFIAEAVKGTSNGPPILLPRFLDQWGN
jgi:hypothetical protein